MDLQVHFFFLMLGVTFATLPPAVAAAAWVGGMALYYGSTMFGEPEHNGAPIVLERSSTDRLLPCSNGCWG